MQFAGEEHVVATTAVATMVFPVKRMVIDTPVGSSTGAVRTYGVCDGPKVVEVNLGQSNATVNDETVFASRSRLTSISRSRCRQGSVRASRTSGRGTQPLPWSSIPTHHCCPQDVQYQIVHELRVDIDDGLKEDLLKALNTVGNVVMSWDH